MTTPVLYNTALLAKPSDACKGGRYARKHYQVAIPAAVREARVVLPCIRPDQDTAQRSRNDCTNAFARREHRNDHACFHGWVGSADRIRAARPGCRESSGCQPVEKGENVQHGSVDGETPEEKDGHDGPHCTDVDGRGDVEAIDHPASVSDAYHTGCVEK